MFIALYLRPQFRYTTRRYGGAINNATSQQKQLLFSNSAKQQLLQICNLILPLWLSQTVVVMTREVMTIHRFQKALVIVVMKNAINEWNENRLSCYLKFYLCTVYICRAAVSQTGSYSCVHIISLHPWVGKKVEPLWWKILIFFGKYSGKS